MSRKWAARSIIRWFTGRCTDRDGARSCRAQNIPRRAKRLAKRLKKLPDLVQEQIATQAAPSDAGRPVRVLWEDEARFGRIRDPRRCWAPAGVRPEVHTQIVREYE
jgi:hypothetical protein